MYGEAPLFGEIGRRALQDLWALTVDRVGYEPIGYGSYHRRATSLDGIELFVTADRAGIAGVELSFVPGAAPVSRG